MEEIDKISKISSTASSSLQQSINRSLELAKNVPHQYRPGQTKSTSHLIYEVNEFYVEMADKLDELKHSRRDNLMKEADGDGEDVHDTDSVLYDVVAAIRKKRNDPGIQHQVQQICEMNQRLDDSTSNLNVEIKKRKSVQKEVYDAIKADHPSAKTRFFKQLCEMENRKTNSTKVSQLAKEQQQQELLAQGDVVVKEVACQNSEQVSQKDNSFIKRNIQLAKSTPFLYTNNLNVTNKERKKLESLLSDLDQPHEGTTKQVADSRSASPSLESMSKSTLFSLENNDSQRLKDLESQLETFSDKAIKGTLCDRDAAKDIDEKKPWLNQQRLKDIDEKLEKLQKQFKALKCESNANVKICETVVPPIEEENASIQDAASLSYDSILAQSEETARDIAKIISNFKEDDDEIVKLSQEESVNQSGGESVKNSSEE